MHGFDLDKEYITTSQHSALGALLLLDTLMETLDRVCYLR